nr:hypothetical protein [Tanacetum cinerariifolium]
MIEEPVKPKKKDQIKLDEEAVKRLQAEFDEEEILARERAKKEQETNIALIETWDDIQAKIDKALSAKRVEEKRNKLPTQAQNKKIMCTYLKNMKGYKLKDLKLKEFDKIQEMFNRAFKRLNTFEYIRTELVKGKEKRAREELIQESTKKQKADTKIVNDDEEHGEEVSHIVALEETTVELDEGQATSDPGKTPMSRPLPAHHVHIENPLSSSGTLSLMKNLDDAFIVGDQFLNDKPSEKELDKANMENWDVEARQSKFGRPTLQVVHESANNYLLEVHRVRLKELVPSLWIESKRDYDISAAYDILHWWDFKNLHLNDFEDLYLLHLQGKLNHLSRADKVHLFNVVNLWIRNIVIRQRVKDLQLGIESYQTKLNLTQPRWDATNFLFKEDYTIVHKLRVVIYKDRNNQKKMMRETVVHKFSDGTLTRILEKLDVMVKDYVLFKFNLGEEHRILSEDDKRRSQEFIKLIVRKLKIRRVFKSLESFVSGRLKDVYYKLV